MKVNWLKLTSSPEGPIPPFSPSIPSCPLSPFAPYRRVRQVTVSVEISVTTYRCYHGNTYKCYHGNNTIPWTPHGENACTQIRPHPPMCTHLLSLLSTVSIPTRDSICTIATRNSIDTLWGQSSLPSHQRHLIEAPGPRSLKQI